MSFRIRIVIIQLLFVFQTASAQNDSIINHIFKLIYNEKFEQAEQALKNSSGFDDSFYVDVLKIDLYWWQYIHDKEKGNQLKATIDSFSDSANSSSEGKIKQLIGTSYQIRFEFNRFNLLGAVAARKEIKQLITKIKQDNSKYSKERAKLFELYNLLFQYFDNLINPLFSENKRLKRASALVLLDDFTKDKDLIVRTLACYFVGKIYLNIEKNPQKSKSCFEFLVVQFPNNSIFNELLLDCNKKI
jgi:hypothetical protein